jgi:uncharacterized protein YjbJ (UPF0337 family)
MKAFPWIIAGIGAGIAAYVILNQPGPQYATGNDDVEDAASRTTAWGSKQRIYGRVTGDDQLADEGFADQVVGAVRNTTGSVAQAAGQTLHELNR